MSWSSRHRRRTSAAGCAEEDCTDIRGCADGVDDGRSIGEYIVEQWQMSGFEPDEENSFEEPEKVVPAYTKRSEKLPAKADGVVSLDLVIPGCSVTAWKIIKGQVGCI